MSLSLHIHAVALLNICDYCTRSGSSSPKFAGALFGSVQEREIVVNQTFEVNFVGDSLDLEQLQQRSQLFGDVSPNQRLIGWFVVGTSSIEPWMVAVHQQVKALVANPVMGQFQIPFAAEMDSLPFKFFDASLEELSVSLKVDQTEQIALNDVLTAQGHGQRSNNIKAQITKETRAMLMLHQHLAKLRPLLAAGEPTEKQAQVVALIHQLCRDHDFESNPQAQQIEQETLSLLIAGLVTRGDKYLLALT